MQEYVFFSILGERSAVESFQQSTGVVGKFLQGAGGTALDFEILAGTTQFAVVEDLIKKHSFLTFRRTRVEASRNELETAEFFSNVGCCWIEDNEDDIEDPSYTGRDACPVCGSGKREHEEPLGGALTSLRKFHLIRKPPAIIAISLTVALLIEKNRWSGAELRPILERTIGKPSNLFKELWVTSVLPPMHPKAGIERFAPSEFCEQCRRIGFQLPSRQPAYGQSVLDVAADWNLSTEWLAPHFVPCPKLICSRRVVHELLKLEPSQKWIPVKLVDD